VQPVLDEDRAVVGQLALEEADALVPGLGLRLGARHELIPAAVVDAEGPLRRQGLPESPERRPQRLVGTGVVEHAHPVAPRVQRRQEPGDGRADAAGLPPLEDDDGRDTGLPEPPLQGAELEVEFLVGELEILFGHFLIQIDRFEHDASSWNQACRRYARAAAESISNLGGEDSSELVPGGLQF